MFSSIRRLSVPSERQVLGRCLTTSTTSRMAETIQNSAGLKDFEEIPSPPALPLLGHMLDLVKQGSRLDKYNNELQAKYGDIVRMYSPGVFGHMVMLYKPKDIKNLFSQEERVPFVPGFNVMEYTREHHMKDRFKTNGLMTNSEDWYAVRSQVQQDLMRPKSALYYIRDLERIAMDVSEQIVEKETDKNGVMDIVKMCQKYSLEAVAFVFLGSRLGALAGTGDGQRLIEIADSTGELQQTLFFMPTSVLPYLPGFKKFIKLTEEQFDISAKNIKHAVDNMAEDSETIIAKLFRKCGRDSPIPFVMAVDMMMAGIDTTGSTATFLLYHLATNPDKQEKLYQEICETIGAQGHLTEAAINNMTYMKAVQMESQRLQPAVWGTSRIFRKDVAIMGYRIPAGTTVARVGSFSAMDPEHFQDPEKFYPERFLRGHKDRHGADSFANIPFGHGARACIGQRFAKLELFTLMIKLVQTYKISYAGEEAVGGVTKFVTVPDKPVKIQFSRR